MCLSNREFGFPFFPQILCKISTYKSKKLSIHQRGQNQRKGQEPHKAKLLNRKGEGEVRGTAEMRLCTLENRCPWGLTIRNTAARTQQNDSCDGLEGKNHEPEFYSQPNYLPRGEELKTFQITDDCDDLLPADLCYKGGCALD